MQHRSRCSHRRAFVASLLCAALAGCASADSQEQADAADLQSDADAGNETDAMPPGTVDAAPTFDAATTTTFDASPSTDAAAVPIDAADPIVVDAGPTTADAAPTIDAPIDAAPVPDAMVVPDAGSTCDPVAQTGCTGSDKCTFVIETTTPLTGRTDCAANGTVALGGACTLNNFTGVDNCLAGGLCAGSGVCEEICSQTPNSCTMATCVHTDGLFEDPNVGFCSPVCDLFTQDCSGTDACYVLLATGETVCAPPLAEEGSTTPGAQGDACNYINTCAEGLGCVLLQAPSSTQQTCAFLCDALDSGGPTCAQGPGANYDCRAINGFYIDAGNVPANIGMCVDPAIFP